MDDELKKYIDRRLLDFGIPMFNSSGILIGVVKRLRSSTNITFTRDGLDGLISGLGGSSNAPIDAQYLVLTADATLTDERIFTPGNGLTGTDGGAGAAYGLALGPLTALWSQTGVFDIEHAGNLRIAKYLRVGGITAPAVTSNGAITGTIIVPGNDANYTLRLVAGNPTMIVDSGNDYFVYNRSTNEFQYDIGGVGVAGFLSTHLYHQSGFAVGSSAAPVASALVELTSTAQGFLPPRMTTTQRDAIASPATSLLIFNTTTNRYEYYDGAAWVPLASVEHHTLDAVMDVQTASTTVPYHVLGPMAAAGTITGVEAIAGENKTNGATSSIFDIHKILSANKNTDGQGTTIFTTQGNRPTITNGNKLSTTTLPDVLTFAAGDAFAVYTDQAGSTLTVATVGMRFTFP